ncbi:hypothetical protein B0A50_03763 [Salinomyces thailandicus]|uniref:Urease accessory protein UreD n=1 Tax=Salinomyces thailandicus TaxID=706561 RepID=A0A4U0U2N6_9PEZI|nr:hypothetical protein B0A50_03763 [Salinomyces thailandica]
MPHKHVRRKDSDFSQFNLAPSTVAKALPTFEQTAKPKSKKDGVQQKPKAKRKRSEKNGHKHDDTPRAFARMMQWQATGKRPSGLDDGNTSRKKKKQSISGKDDTSEATSKKALDLAAEKAEVPRIQPGEKLSDYAARVDQALPMGGLTRKGKMNVEGMKERRTKTEKRLHKMYASWREEEARLKEKEEERQEQEEEEEEEKQAEYGDVHFPQSSKKRRKMVGETDDQDDDPWAVLKQRRAEVEAEPQAANQRARKGGLRGLHDVVQAPPTMKVVPKEKFKVRNNAKVNVANIPAASGSLKRREELSDARTEVIERYRAMMRDKSGA